jgi:predicted ribosome-associated RNA-binding protein Tma20
MYTINGTPMWWNHFDGPFIPTLKLLHRCKLSDLDLEYATAFLLAFDAKPLMLMRLHTSRAR